jgi:tripartite-type tricarboxylate transporter receptor subunit TctC
VVTAAATVAITVAVLGAAPAAAQSYPTRPITMVVPFPPGGSTDVIGRILAERMKKPLGQSVIIENVGGAAGVIGVGRVARAAPDGYTIDIGQWDTHVANAAIYPLTYDLVKDFEPIAPISSNPYMMLARKGMAGDDLKGLIAWLKANPGKATVASPTAGSQVAGAYFQSLTGTQMQIVPYRGAAPAMQDLVAGQIDLLFVQPAVALPQVRAGAIKVYAVTGPRRLPTAPEIPTVDEAGLSSLHVLGWYGLFAPKGTAKDIIAKLSAALADALADPTVQARLADLGQEILAPQTPEALAALQKSEFEKWLPIIKAANIKAE